MLGRKELGDFYQQLGFQPDKAFQKKKIIIKEYGKDYFGRKTWKNPKKRIPEKSYSKPYLKKT